MRALVGQQAVAEEKDETEDHGHCADNVGDGEPLLERPVAVEIVLGRALDAASEHAVLLVRGLSVGHGVLDKGSITGNTEVAGCSSPSRAERRDNIARAVWLIKDSVGWHDHIAARDGSITVGEDGLFANSSEVDCALVYKGLACRLAGEQHVQRVGCVFVFDDKICE